MVNDNLVLGEDNPIFLESESPSDAVATSQEESQPDQPVIEDESQYLITLDRRQFEAQLMDLIAKDAEIRNIYNRSVGNKAASQYQPTIKKLESDLDTYRALLRREKYSKLSEEEINQRFREDPAFAQDYSRIVHFQGEEPNEAANRRAIAQHVFNSVGTILNMGARQGLTQEDLIELDQNIRNGKYDVDEFGEPIPTTRWQEMLDNVQDAVTEKLLAKRNQSVDTVTNQPTDKVITTPPTTSPQHVDTARPDISMTGNRGVRTSSITMREFRQLPIEEQIKMFPNDGDIEKAVADGRIIVEGLET